MREYTEMLKAIASEKSGGYTSPFHSLKLPSDGSIIADTTDMIRRYWTTNLRYIIVIGIGGANLGSKAVYDALRGPNDGYMDGYPKILFSDTISERFISDIKRIIDGDVSYSDEIILNLISKSGTTIETIANFELLFEQLEKRFPNIAERVVVSTEVQSPLFLESEKKGFGVLSIPKHIGGRWSVFSHFGLFPLGMAGVDITALTEGGKEILTSFFSKENHALRLAEAMYHAYQKNKRILNFFFFNPELESLGKWSRQLYAESLGKQHDRSGKTVNIGFTPLVTIGTTDLHSMAQLYLAGPDDKFTLFIFSPHEVGDPIRSQRVFPHLAPEISRKSPTQILNAIYKGTKIAYDKHRFSTGEILLPAISPYALGMFFQTQILTVMYLAELLHVNAFDQPSVEEYKKVAHEILRNE